MFHSNSLLSETPTSGNQTNVTYKSESENTFEKKKKAHCTKIQLHGMALSQDLLILSFLYRVLTNRNQKKQKQSIDKLTSKRNT